MSRGKARGVAVATWKLCTPLIRSQYKAGSGKVVWIETRGERTWAPVMQSTWSDVPEKYRGPDFELFRAEAVEKGGIPVLVAVLDKTRTHCFGFVI
jgi:hypothetical protein